MTATAAPRDLLHRHFGFREFLEGQGQVIDSIIDGHDALVIMPTGGGKSLCYQLPALSRNGLTLVISPLIALMKDQVDGLAAKGIPAAFINSSLSLPEIDQRLDSMRRGDLKIVYIAPERFKSRRFVEALKEVPIELFALDEAHCLSQWGHDFRPDYLRLKSALKSLGSPQTVALTATATPVVRQDIIDQLELGKAGRRPPKIFVTGFARHNLHLRVSPVRGKAEKLGRLFDVVRECKTGIVYCATRKNVDMVAKELKRAKIPCIAYHGAMDEEKRSKAQMRFMDGKCGVAVATNAFGMGIDRADLRFVLHYDIPGSVEAYYQEAGRAGRDGESARCELLYNYADVRTQEFFIDGANPTREVISDSYSVVQRLCAKGAIQIPVAKIATHIGKRVNSMAVGTALRLLQRADAIEREYHGSRTYTTSLREPVRNLDDLGFDFEKLEVKRERDGEKLRQIIRYASHSGCLHRFILDYFGDDEAPDSCDACENCRSRATRLARPLSGDEAETVRSVLACVSDLNGRFGRGRISQILAGSRSKEILDFGLDRLASYGLLSERGADYAFSLLNELIEAGCLDVAPGKYPTLSLSALGRDVVENEARLNIAMPKAVAKNHKSPKRKQSAPQRIDAGIDGPLFEKLRQWRFKKAKKSRIPAYMIFNDATLQELARLTPRTNEELLAIKGIGPSKAKKLGKETLALIADHTGSAAPEQASAPAEESFFETVEDDSWQEEEFNG